MSHIISFFTLKTKGFKITYIPNPIIAIYNTVVSFL